MTDKTPPRPARAGGKENVYNPARPSLFKCPKCGKDGRRENCPDVATCPFHALPLRAAYQKAQADMNESMQRRLDRIASEIPWPKHNLVEDLEGFCPKCGAPKHVGECPGSMKAAREFNQPVMDAFSELKAENARLRARLEMGIGVCADGKPVAIPDEYDGIFARDETIRLQDAELTRLRRQNRRLRRKLAREREAWDRALEVAARIAGIASADDGAKVAAMSRAAKLEGEE